ncbi:uncharacterized protein TNCV_3344621 [Trichonephila clavipes]|nr:uncharacterized protein TNCV_3344621 [Trichonephila clavipes]
MSMFKPPPIDVVWKLVEGGASSAVSRQRKPLTGKSNASSFLGWVWGVKTGVNFGHGRVLISGRRSMVKCFRLSKLLELCQVVYSQFGLAIHQNDHQARRRFVEWAQNEIAVVPDFHKLFSDEAHFWFNGYVNKQNCRIWSEANPQVYVETPLHPEKLTVWCALWAGGIIGPYFFKNDEGHNVSQW